MFMRPRFKEKDSPMKADMVELLRDLLAEFGRPGGSVKLPQEREWIVKALGVVETELQKRGCKI
jgi:hypothetical protein